MKVTARQDREPIVDGILSGWLMYPDGVSYSLLLRHQDILSQAGVYQRKEDIAPAEEREVNLEREHQERR